MNLGREKTEHAHIKETTTNPIQIKSNVDDRSVSMMKLNKPIEIEIHIEERKEEFQKLTAS